MPPNVLLGQKARGSAVSIRRRGHRILRWFVLPLFLAGVCAATPEVSTETAPAGGWVQIKIRGVASGRITLDLDPSVFGDIADAAAFSANGDAYGSANISGRHLDAQVFKPAARGSAQVRNLPVLVINAPVLASAPAGKSVAVTAIANGVSLLPGSVTIAGSLSVRSIAPGGGILPAGTVLHINGTGFTPSTSVQADAVSISDTYFAGPEEMQVTLGAPTELTGKRFVLQDPDGSEVEYFSFLLYKPIETAQVFGSQLLFPAQAWSAPMHFGLSTTIIPRTNFVAIQNPNLVPVDVTLQTGDYTYPYQSSTNQTISGGGGVDLPI